MFSRHSQTFQSSINGIDGVFVLRFWEHY